VAEELGTWPAEQATVLLEVLQQAGLNPTATRTREGILVTVPEGESDEAHRQLVSHMDQIARAARPPASQRGKRAKPQRGAPKQKSETLASERMLGMARPVVVVLVALLVLGAVALRQPLIAILAIGALIYVIGKRAQDRGDDPRDPRDGR
jgi:hypothetical protein